MGRRGTKGKGGWRRIGRRRRSVLLAWWLVAGRMGARWRQWKRLLCGMAGASGRDPRAGMARGRDRMAGRRGERRPSE